MKLIKTRLLTQHLNCSTCFNRVLDELAASPSVSAVHANAANRWIDVEHAGDPQELITALQAVGRGAELAYNGEIEMVQADAVVDPTVCPVCGQQINPGTP